MNTLDGRIEDVLSRIVTCIMTEYLVKQTKSAEILYPTTTLGCDTSFFYSEFLQFPE